MNAKVAELSEDAIADVEEIIGVTNEEEQSEVNSLTYGKPKSLFYTYFANFVKRTVDIIAGIVGLIVLIPLTIAIYIANKIFKEDGPIFYVQERIGKDGKTFKMLKYRSMVVGAEEKLQKYLEENEEARKEYSEYKKLKYDPRITKIGRFLRKTSIDEMPQLLHLLTRRDVTYWTKTIFAL